MYGPKKKDPKEEKSRNKFSLKRERDVIYLSPSITSGSATVQSRNINAYSVHSPLTQSATTNISYCSTASNKTRESRSWTNRAKKKKRAKQLVFEDEEEENEAVEEEEEERDENNGSHEADVYDEEEERDDDEEYKQRTHKEGTVSKKKESDDIPYSNPYAIEWNEEEEEEEEEEEGGREEEDKRKGTERLKRVHWRAWKTMSHTTFLCNGRIMCGHDWHYFLVTISLLTISSFFFFIFMLQHPILLFPYFTISLFIAFLLFLLDLFLLLRAAFTDPGYLPRKRPSKLSLSLPHDRVANDILYCRFVHFFFFFIKHIYIYMDIYIYVCVYI
ncbi:hypothetical protein RFI_21789 [Reticulomyxa filosa]|uniref:Uncharacterized protein n=1 Tax=Reticulomyxa filosa TaxID=46433 RepID=X6MQ65_RETFI|nr:hypothetical protein RFI_21789 [Reticulomyxa filosa]|eukprot:ETO15577.1 hypothetical protein RFI_21789 [Reticulomyxa filosa]